MNRVSIDPLVFEYAPHYHLAVLTCSLLNSGYSDALWKELSVEMERFRRQYSLVEINKRPEISAMRRLYKRAGKDPNRYRPSCEALCRRIVQEKSLYPINTLVDAINLISIYTGFSIGGFDRRKIVGDIRLGIGRSGERFEAIGRGLLNIEGLPVYRDAVGGIGTPTSDEERTKIELQTTDLLMIINSAEGENGVENAVSLSRRILSSFLDASDVRVYYM